MASKLGIIAGLTIAGVAGLVVLSTTNKIQEDGTPFEVAFIDKQNTVTWRLLIWTKNKINGS